MPSHVVNHKDCIYNPREPSEQETIKCFSGYKTCYFNIYNKFPPKAVTENDIS